MDFSAAAKAQMEGAIVRMSILVEFLFVSQTVRIWQGRSRLETLDSKIWEPDKGMGSISAISQSYNGSAPPLKIALSGVDPDFALLAKSEHDEYYNQPVVIYMQFFKLAEEGAEFESWQRLDNPYPLSMYRMFNITTSVEPSDEEGINRIYSVAINCETPFVVKKRPRFGYYTDNDQRARVAPDVDKGLERIAGIDNRFIDFPVF